MQLYVVHLLLQTRSGSSRWSSNERSRQTNKRAGQGFEREGMASIQPRQRQHIKFGTHGGFMALPMQDEPGVLRAESDQYCLSATFLRCGPVVGSHEESAHSHTMFAVQNCHLPAMSTCCSSTRGASVALGLPMKLPGVVRVSAVRHAHPKAKYTYTLSCVCSSAALNHV